MVRVEAPPIRQATPPPRDRTFPWLEGATLLILAAAIPPWERWCHDSPVDLADPFEVFQRCFAARLWGGSASLLGLSVVVLAVAILLGSLVARRRRPGLLRISAFSAMVAAMIAKSLITSANGGITADNQGLLLDPVAVGLYFGMVAILVAAAAFAWTLWKERQRRSLIVVAVVVGVLVAGVAVAYSRSGLAAWGGPLVEPRFLGGGNGVGMVVEPGRPEAFAHLLFFRNLSSVPITFDGLDVVDTNPPIRVLGTYVVRGTQPCPPASVELDVRHPLEGCVYPLAGYRFEPGGVGSNVTLAFVFEVQEPGVYRTGWFRVRYHTGRLTFEVFRTDELIICAPEPGRKRCPGDGS